MELCPCLVRFFIAVCDFHPWDLRLTELFMGGALEVSTTAKVCLRRARKETNHVESCGSH